MPRIDLAERLSRQRTEEPHATQLGPKFARLSRKEARVREDQYSALSALARTLMRQRSVKSERITENTLIRVAIDLLLAHTRELSGATEEQLRESVVAKGSGIHSRDTRAARDRGLADDERGDVA
ncbi:MAG: hypothetical protein ACTHNQ_19475 [Microbacterium sp.]|uniref:hypothetical protein n=1 Tax=Microbacterium sp. TaxID=51671 RepID=UPI003F8115B5